MQYEEGLGVKPVGVQSIQLLPHLLQLSLAALWRGEPGAHEQEGWVLWEKAREPFIPISQMSCPSSMKTTTPSIPWGVAGYSTGDFLPRDLLGIVVFQLRPYLVELKELDMVGGRHRSGSLQAH